MHIQAGKEFTHTHTHMHTLALTLVLTHAPTHTCTHALRFLSHALLRVLLGNGRPPSVSVFFPPDCALLAAEVGVSYRC